MWMFYPKLFQFHLFLFILVFIYNRYDGDCKRISSQLTTLKQENVMIFIEIYFNLVFDIIIIFFEYIIMNASWCWQWK